MNTPSEIPDEEPSAIQSDFSSRCAGWPEASSTHQKSGHDKYRYKFIRSRKNKQTVWENWWKGSLLDLAKWMDTEIRQRREQQSADFEWEYAFVYFQECELAHTGTTSLAQYLRPDSATVFPSTNLPLWLPYSASVRFLRTADITRIAYEIEMIEDFLRARDDIERLNSEE